MIIVLVLLCLTIFGIMWYAGVFDRSKKVELPNPTGVENTNPCKSLIFSLTSTHNRIVVYENCAGEIVKLNIESETTVCGKSVLITGANIEVTELPFCK